MSGEKTEKPTPKKLRDARKKGQVAKSKEIGSASVLVTCFIVLWAGWPWFSSHFEAMFLLPTTVMHLPFRQALSVLVFGLMQELALISLMVAGPALIMAVAGNFFQIGFLFAPESIKPQAKKLNPAEGFKKIFSSSNLLELVKSLIKVAVLAITLYLILRVTLNDLIRIPHMGIAGVIKVSFAILFRLALATSLAFIAVAGLDHWLQNKLHIKKLKMSKDEVKREYKESEGDPLIKGKRRQLHQEMANQSSVEKARKATVLVTNPIHFAVAIHYEPGKTKLPRVTARGRDFLARRMAAAARDSGVPVIENVPLARALYRRSRINDYIPTHLLAPVAELLRTLTNLERDSDRRQA